MEISSFLNLPPDRGRKVSVLFHCTQNGAINLEDDEIDGEIMQDYLEDWMKQRALNHNCRVKRTDKRYNDAVSLERARINAEVTLEKARLQSARAVAVAYAKSAPRVVYNVHGWW